MVVEHLYSNAAAMAVSIKERVSSRTEGSEGYAAPSLLCFLSNS